MTDSAAKKGKPGPRYVLSLVLMLMLAILVVIFTIQNSDPVSIKFGPGTAQVSLALVLFGVLLCGVLLTILVGLPRNWRRRREIAKLKKTEKSLRAELSRLKAKQVGNPPNPTNQPNPPETKPTPPRLAGK